MSLISYDNLKADEKIIKSIAFLNRNYPFFARIMLSLNRHEVHEDSDITTMGVNQYGHLFFNKEFVNKLTFDELQAVLAHECCHVALLTFQREKGRDSKLWNIATDIAINWILISSGMTLPSGVLLPDQNGIMKLEMADLSIDVKDIPAEKIYEILEKESEKVLLNYKSFDTHIQGDGDGDGGSTGEESENNGKDKNEAKQKNSHKWKQISANAVAFAKSRGNIGTAIERLLDGILRPKLNWKELLNKYITRELPYDFTYSRPGKKTHSTGFYMPNIIKENLNITVTCDVSGSISDEEYKEFMSEILGIINSHSQVKARVLFWSTYIDERDDKIITRDSANELKNYTANSSGGTYISCVNDYVKEKGLSSRLYVHLTDGYVEHDPILPDGVNICVISKNGSDTTLSKHAICCSLNDSGD